MPPVAASLACARFPAAKRRRGSPHLRCGSRGDSPRAPRLLLVGACYRVSRLGPLARRPPPGGRLLVGRLYEGARGPGAARLAARAPPQPLASPPAGAPAFMEPPPVRGRSSLAAASGGSPAFLCEFAASGEIRGGSRSGGLTAPPRSRLRARTSRR